MALPFFASATKRKRDQMLAIDLGGRKTKAVHLQRRSDGFALCRYALLDAPVSEKGLSVNLVSEHLKAVCLALETKTKFVTLALGVDDALVRNLEMPRMQVEDTRQILRVNSRNFLQQDLADHVFDCWLMPVKRQPKKPGEAAKSPSETQKNKVLVTGAKQQLIDDLQTAIKNAGLVADRVIPGLIGPANAFEMALPEVFAKETVALVDLGFKHSTICILQEGDLVLSRVVAIGGDRLTTSLAETMGISYLEAEGIKVGMAAEVESTLEPLLVTLGRELRASIDFFEHQQDKPISHVYFSGGSARSEFIVAMLQVELVVECKTWNPATFLQMALPPHQAAEIDAIAPQLTVAIGAAAAEF
jgi:type IV pilus assembly protein PilM